MVVLTGCGTRGSVRCSSEVVELGWPLDGEVVTGLPVMRPGVDHRWLLTQRVIHALRDGLRFTADPIPDMPPRYAESPWIALVKSVINAKMDPIYDLPDMPDHPWQGWDYWCNPIFFGGWTRADRVAVERVVQDSMVEVWQQSDWFRQAREENARWVAEHVDAAVRKRLFTKYGSPTAA